ncbi:hypothetical protein Bca52824_024334 [Brassica carinata]|uniref:F-box domain-containing protein n=1 Tax=Brassica carinata TaxID=52824 RepID=A0A8X8AWM4_BRACI|nr:hypothetical protein Bca52824_024334 [Brassica carinata]
MWWNCTNKWKKSSSPPCALSLLPDDILLNCFASVSKSDHASLSLVNKGLLLSPELYQVRSLMGCTENCIFLCLSIPLDPFVRWFAFYPKALNNPGRLVPIRPHLYQPQEASSAVAYGCGIYIIAAGGTVQYGPYSSVMHESVVREGKKVFSLNGKGTSLVYIPREGIWRKGKSDAYRPRRG